MMKRSACILLFICSGIAISFAQPHALVFQSDFGLKDGAVSAMKGVAFSVSPELRMFDITHDIPAFNIWEGAYRLNQVAAYWPAGTVFVSVVDPGVGSDRNSIVMKSKTGHYFVTPDNGTLTLIAENLGVAEVRLIDEKHRLQNSDDSYTFHGRDVYAYTGAKLAAGVIKFEDVGAILSSAMITLPYQKPVFENGVIKGSLDILDIQYGNVWTNIDQKTLNALQVNHGDKVHVKIFENAVQQYEGTMVFGKTFSDVKEGQTIAYMNSLLNFSIGINQDNFALKNGVGSGPTWRIEVRK